MVWTGWLFGCVFGMGTGMGSRLMRVSGGVLAIEGTADGQTSFVEDVGIDHGGANVFVAEEFLHGANIVPRFEEMGGKGMAEGVTGDAFGEPQELNGFSNDLLDGSLPEMMSPHQPGVGVG